MWRARAIGRIRRAIDWLVVNQFPAIEGQQDRCRLVVSAIQHVTYGALMPRGGNKTPYMACCDVVMLRARYGVL
jgi:hypothetical protein